MKSAWHVNREIKIEAKQVSNFILFLADFDVFFQTPVQRKQLAPVVQRADNSIQGINRYPADEMYSNQYITCEVEFVLLGWKC